LSDPVAFTKEAAKEYARRHVFILFFVLAILASVFTINEESDMILHVLDDYILVAISAIALVAIAVRWKKSSFQDLRSINNIATGLAFVGLIAVIFAFTQEINDAADFGNDPGQLIAILGLLVNRFV
jgi:hypothetical protein